MAKVLIVPIFIPHLGCKHACVFCNQKKIAGEYNIPSKETMIETVKEYRASAKAFDEVQLAFYGGSFTGLDDVLRLHLLTVAKELKDEGLIDKIRFSTRPDYINQEIIDELKTYQTDIVELGAQSMDDEVLLASERGHCALQTQLAARLLKENHFVLGLQMMVALPKDRKNFGPAIRPTAVTKSAVPMLDTKENLDLRSLSKRTISLFPIVKDGM